MRKLNNMNSIPKLDLDWLDDSQEGREFLSMISHSGSHPALSPKVLEALSPAVKYLKCEVDHSPPSSVKI
jgi:hypothetical protein